MHAIDTGLDSHLYNVLLLLHLLAVIVGFGAVLLNGVYGVQSLRRPGAEGRAVSEVNYTATMIGEKFIYAVPVLGLLLVWASDGAWSLGDTWVWLSIVIYVVAMAVSVAVLQPNHRRLNDLLRQREAAATPATVGGSAPSGAGAGGTDPGAAAEAIGRQQAQVSTVLHLALVVILVLMIWKPGA